MRMPGGEEKFEHGIHPLGPTVYSACMSSEQDPKKSLRDRIMAKERARKEAADDEDRQLNEEMKEPMQRETMADLRKRLGYDVNLNMPYPDALTEMARQKAEIEETRREQERIRTETLQQMQADGEHNAKGNRIAIGIAFLSLVVAVVAIFV